MASATCVQLVGVRLLRERVDLVDVAGTGAGGGTSTCASGGSGTHGGITSKASNCRRYMYGT